MRHTAARVILSTLMLASCASTKVKDSPPRTFFAVIISDMDSSLKWYSEVFDLEVVTNTTMADRGIKQANLINDQLRVELIEMSSASARPEGYAEGLFKAGLEVRDFEKWLSRFEALGVELKGDVVKDNKGKSMVIVLDPDDNRIQLFEK